MGDHGHLLPMRQKCGSSRTFYLPYLTKVALRHILDDTCATCFKDASKEEYSECCLFWIEHEHTVYWVPVTPYQVPHVDSKPCVISDLNSPRLGIHELAETWSQRYLGSDAPPPIGGTAASVEGIRQLWRRGPPSGCQDARALQGLSPLFTSGLLQSGLQFCPLVPRFLQVLH